MGIVVGSGSETLGHQVEPYSCLEMSQGTRHKVKYLNSVAESDIH
jgi:hypothetical protein